MRCSTATARAWSGPSPLKVRLRFRTSSVRGTSTARPMLPNMRPSPPLRSRNPRCRRAGATTRMAPGCARARWAGASVCVASASGITVQPAGAKRPHGGGEDNMAAEREKPMPDAEVNAWLQKNLPKWRLEDGWIRRTYKTSGWKGTLMVINTVGHLAEAAWHHPDITASYAWVEVRLMTHTAKGITDKDLELAKKIEDVVHWQPRKDEGALEGTPHGDQRFAYIKYD